jgi:signal transduction histidine kinase
VFWTIVAAVVASTAVTVVVAALLLRGAVRDRVLENLRVQAVSAQRVLNRPAPGLAVEHGLYDFFRAQQEFLGLPGDGVPGPRIRDALLRAAGDRTSGVATVGAFHAYYATGTTVRGEFVLARLAGLGVDDWRPFLWWLVLAAVVGAAASGVGAYFATRRIVDPGREVSSTSARDAERALLLSVSDGLKPPLAAIRGHAEALKEDAVPPAEAAGAIEAESARLERLERDLRDLAGPDRRGLAGPAVRVDLGRVAREVEGRHAAAAEGFGVRLAVDAVPGSVAMGDHDRVSQVASNLVEGALRVTPSGGAVSIQARPGTLTVTDTGPGLAPEDVPRAFEPFPPYGQHEGDRPSGSGLSLAVAQRLVRDMGGTIQVHSTVGQGSTFVVSLPLVPENQPAPVPRPPDRPGPLEGWFHDPDAGQADPAEESSPPPG